MPQSACWVVTEGHVGMESQARGLAEAMALPHEVKRVRLRFPWAHVPPSILVPPLAALAPAGDALAPPWPRLLVTCGRRSTGISRAVKRASGGATLTVHIQDPLIDPRHFDLVVMPAHDRQRGRAEAANVLITLGSLHRVTPARLAEEAARFAGAFDRLPRPRVAALIGGTNRYYRLTPAVMRDVADGLARLARAEGGSVLATVSRRTGPENAEVLRRALAGLPAYLWDGAGDNPYFALLEAADAIVVTCDSVNMVSEACATGKPVHVIDLPGGSRRFAAFHEAMRAAGCTRPFAGRLERWRYAPPDDMTRVAEAVRSRLAPAAPSAEPAEP